MRADLTGTVTQTQPQYQTSELLIGALLQGYRVAEVPTVMRQRMSGESKKGRNLAYGLRYARVIAQTYLRERRAAGQRLGPPAQHHAVQPRAGARRSAPGAAASARPACELDASSTFRQRSTRRSLCHPQPSAARRPSTR